MYNGILLSHKRNEIMPSAATWMDLEIIILSKVSQKEKEKYHMISLTCGILSKTQMNIFMKQIHRYRKQTCDWRSVGEEGLRIAEASYYIYNG